MIEVFSSGGGTQSTAIAALIIQGKLPTPDYIVIADTGREMPTTWAYMKNVVQPALENFGVEVHRVSGWKSVPDHGRDWQSHNGNTIIVPAFTRKSGAVGKLPNFCTNTWKVEVVDRYLSKRFGVTRKQYRKWIGFSFDEQRRTLRMMDGKEYKAGLVRFPLVELTIRRQEAINAVREIGWPEPPRSRCWMCSNQTDYEWNQVKTKYPTLWDEAICLDKDMRKYDEDIYLHASARPLSEVDVSREDDLFGGGCHSGECFL